jgi:hypothetical protein
VKKKLKKFCSCETYYDIRSINLKNNAMKKQEMIDAIIQEHDVLWNEYMEMLEAFGINDEGTQRAGTRAATLGQLIDKLEIR